jgi:hypothetical protein
MTGIFSPLTGIVRVMSGPATGLCSGVGTGAAAEGLGSRPQAASGAKAKPAPASVVVLKKARRLIMEEVPPSKSGSGVFQIRHD